MNHKKLIVVVAIFILAIPCLWVASNNHSSEAQSNEPQEQQKLEGIRNSTQMPSFPPTIAHEQFYAESMGTLSLSDIYPPNDELTELMVGEPLTPYFYIEVPAWGYWYDHWNILESKVFINNADQREGQLCVGTQCRYLASPPPPHYLVLELASPIDARQWQALHFYQALDYYATGYCQFGFIDTSQKYATKLYQLPIGSWQPVIMDYSNLAGWDVDAGFNWAGVWEIVFWASCYQTYDSMLIDFPRFYRTGVPVPDGRVDDVLILSGAMKLCAELWHDGHSDTSTQWDYYLVYATLEDIGYKNSDENPDPQKQGIHPLFARMEFQMQGWCEEFPSNHIPKAGSYGSNPVSVGYSAYGFGFSITIPAYNVKWHQWQETEKLISRWDMDSWVIKGALVSGFIFKDYVSFALAFRVPEGRKPFVYVGAQIKWYQITEHGTFAPYDNQQIYWASVDPIGAGAFPPVDPDPIEVPIGEINRETKPTAKFSFSPQFPFVGQTVTFNASESYDPDGYITTYQWNWGDGSPTETKTQPIAYHAFNQGLYQVKLTVTDNEGLSASTTQQVCP